ncbi:MAG: DUF4238 domain-containing protein [Patescibacteria group bacterium]|jgi:hypothetical protein
MRCHYVPQFYLRNFSIPEKLGYIFAYSRKGQPFKTTINSVAAKNDLYILKNKDGKKYEGLEEMFATLEGDCKPIIEKIINTEEINISDDEKVLMSYFIAFLYTRNLSHLEQQKNSHTALMKKVMQMNAQNKENFKKILEGSKYKINLDDDKEVEDLRNSILNFDEHFKIKYSKNSDDYFIANGMKVGMELVPYIFDKNWRLLISRGSRVFIISDNPVVLIRPTNLPHFYGNGFANSHIYLPLSPKISLILNTKKGDIKIADVKRENVDYLNSLIMFYAHQFIYLNLLSNNINNLFKQTKEGESEQIIFG